MATHGWTGPTLVVAAVAVAVLVSGCGGNAAHGSAPTLPASSSTASSSTASSSTAASNTAASNTSASTAPPSTTPPSVTAPPTTVPATTTRVPRTTTTVARTTTTKAHPTTTVAALPPSPQPSPDAAATVFVDDWKAANRSGAATVATAKAVRALFASAYAGQTVIDRGCSVTFVPRVCSWGDYGGGSGPLYEIDIRPIGANWYVSGASVGP
jgi:hypothetical protein